jgi:putative transposase
MTLEDEIKYDWFTPEVKLLSTKIPIPTSNFVLGKYSFNGIQCEIIKINNPETKSFDYHLIENNQEDILKKTKEKYEKRKLKIQNSDKPQEKKEISLKTLQTKFEKKNKNVNHVLKCRKYELNFNSNQIIILNDWFNECEKIYNYCVDKYNIDSQNFCLDYMKLKLIIFEELYSNTKKNAPYDMLTDQIRLFCSNIKSCFTNLRNGNITHFTITHLKCKNQISVLVPNKSINKNGIFTSLLGKIPNFSNKIKTEIIQNDCRLVFDKVLKRYYLYVPIFFEKKITENKKPFVSIDPGEKNFIAYYSLDEFGKLGMDMRKPILNIRSQISKYQRALRNKVNRRKTKLKNVKKLTRKIQRKYNKIKNIVNELHHQSANYLCKNFERILLPIFGTKKMVCNKEERKAKIRNNIEKIKEESNNEVEIKNKIKSYRRRRRLNRKVCFVLNQLSHYKFKQHIQHKSEEYGCKVYIVTEEYTSQACVCGELSKTYNNDRVKQCSHCGVRIDRDLNGARNIFLKNHLNVIR